MIVYILFYLFSFFLSFKIKKGKYTFYDIVWISVMILFSGLRYKIGSDYQLYEEIYKRLNDINLSSTSRSGIGYTYYSYFMKYFLKVDFKVLIFCTSLITNFLIYKFLKKSSIRPGFSILCYLSLGFYTMSFNVFRQFLSLALILTGYDYLQNKKIIRTIVYFIMGISVHSIAVIPVTILIIFTIRTNIELDIKFSNVIFIILFVLFFDKTIGFLLANWNQFSVYANKIDSYNGGVGTLLNCLAYLMIYVILIFMNKDKIVETKKYINYSFIGLVLILMSPKLFLLSRIASYFNVFNTLVLPEAYEIMDLRHKKIESILYYLCFFIYFCMSAKYFGGCVPYQTIWGI